MRIVAFINLKGGTGKTVSAANMAHILAAYHNKKVLLVDGDKQGSVSQYFQVYGEHDGTAALLLADALDTESMEQVIYQTGYRGWTSSRPTWNCTRQIGRCMTGRTRTRQGFYSPLWTMCAMIMISASSTMGRR